MANKQQAIDYITSKVAADEPVFVIRAQDRFAPQVIRYWSALVQRAMEQEGMKAAGNKRVAFQLSNAQQNKLNDALAMADDAEQWGMIEVDDPAAPIMIVDDKTGASVQAKNAQGQLLFEKKIVQRSKTPD